MEKNLKPQNKRTKSEQREIAQKGGKASGKARRKRKAMKEALELILSLPVQDRKNIDKIKTLLGLNEKEINNQTLIMASTFNQAIKGNIQAAIFIRDTIGEKPIEKIESEEEISYNIKVDYGNEEDSC